MEMPHGQESSHTYYSAFFRRQWTVTWALSQNDSIVDPLAATNFRQNSVSISASSLEARGIFRIPTVLQPQRRSIITTGNET